MSFAYAVLAAQAVAVVLAWVLTKRRPEHRPVAFLLTAFVGLDLLLKGYDLAILAPLRDELGLGPWTGWARAAGTVGDAFGLLWPTALVASALVVFLRKKPWVTLVGWVSAVGVLAAVHPVASDGSLGRYLASFETIGAVTTAVIAVGWFARTKKPGNSAQLTLAIIALAEVIALLGAWRLGPFQDWLISQALYMMMLVSIVAVHGRYLWSPQSQLSA